MTNPRIEHLNRLLRDNLGGHLDTPLYKWIHSRDRELFCYLGRLDSTCARVQFEAVPQIDDVRWSLAMWMAPPPREMWELQFDGQVAYPENGYYIAADTPCDWILEQGGEPNERITNYIIGLRKKEIAMKLKGIAQNFANARQYREKESGRMVDDILTDSFTAFGQVPGVKGSASFGGI